jgi:AcrR family transcriptional regulator
MPGRKKSPAKREDILAAAVAEFAHRDFHEVLMDDVAARAGVGKGTLYRYFPTKEELFVAAVLRELSESHTEHLSTLDDEKAPLREVLERTVSRMVEYFDGKEEILTLLQRYEHRLPASDAAVMRQRRAEVLDAVEGALARNVRAGLLRRIDTRLAAEMLLGMVRTAVLYRRENGGALEHTTREIVSLFLDGVHSRSAQNARAPLRAVRRARG